MRKMLSQVLEEYHDNKNFVFLTGDLGFQALEPLRELLKERFINAGIAEQNMVGVAAGLSKSGLRPWVYSIAPFLYARTFEQIRNDVCFHNLPVTFIGNGGGYAYGVMGSSHHAIEDYGALSVLPNMKIFIPAFREDIKPIVENLFSSQSPSYLRLGQDEKPSDFLLPDYAPVRKILSGTDDIVLFCGPLVGGYLKIASTLSISDRPTIWVISELSHGQDPISQELWSALKIANRVVVVEEHTSNGSLGMQLAYYAQRKGLRLKNFSHLHALGYPSGRLGSQNYHRKESAIDAHSLHLFLKEDSHA